LSTFQRYMIASQTLLYLQIQGKTFMFQKLNAPLNGQHAL